MEDPLMKWLKQNLISIAEKCGLVWLARKTGVLARSAVKIVQGGIEVISRVIEHALDVAVKHISNFVQRVLEGKTVEKIVAGARGERSC
jgi:hypothetical protein